MGVHDLKQTLLPDLPGLSALTMRYDRKTGGQIFTPIIGGESFPVVVAGNATPQQTVAAILDGVKRARDKNNDGTSDNVQ